MNSAAMNMMAKNGEGLFADLARAYKGLVGMESACSSEKVAINALIAAEVNSMKGQIVNMGGNFETCLVES